MADTRESPALPVARGLLSRGADVYFHDPLVTEFDVDGALLPRVTALQPELRAADLVILMQDHRSYDLVQLASSGCLLLDTRGKTAGAGVTLL